MKCNVSYQRFCLITVLIIVGALLFNLLVWRLLNRQLLTPEAGVYIGELAQTGYLYDHTAPRRNTIDLPHRHLRYAEYAGQKIDVLTIGDSFSQGGGNGPNRFYQDYIVSLQDLAVLNLPVKIDSANNLIESVAILVNSGFLEHINPRYILLQRSEKNLYQFAETTDLGKSLPPEQIKNMLANTNAPADSDAAPGTLNLPGNHFLNPANLKWLWYKIGYFFSHNAFISHVYREELDRSLFSGAHGDALLFLDKSLDKHRDKQKALDERAVRRINDNLNRLASLLAETNIRLVFMPVPDKYSLYRPYLREKHYSRSAFFEHLRWQPKVYQLIDTDTILAQELKNGVKDLYWIDDTHWSGKASKAIFEQFRFEK
ncbi:MAG: hypothetical protein RQ724_08270 [Desulfuromonadales bacterium]|nr:hypothetical protein [Desulfuromonadales bacterium]